MPNLILSTCGTSFFTNGLNAEERILVNKYSNEKDKKTIPKEDLIKLESIIRATHNQAQQADFNDITRMSAELNALVRFYKFNTFSKQDTHILLCTDTWLCEEATKIVEEYIRRKGCNQVIIYRQNDLRTDNLQNFHLALTEIVKWVDENILSYREKKYYIVFNLTGGFKSVHGFFQTLALFYADEIIYIFESQKELLRIPRLPVKMITTEVVEKHFTVFRAFSLGLDVDKKDLESIPNSLLFEIDNKYSLSPFGELIWLQAKRQLYEKELHPSPHKLIEFSEDFKKTVNNLPSDQKGIINERIDDLVLFITTQKNINSLGFKQLKGNPRPPSTHECNAWSDKDARRIFLHYEGEKLVLDSLDKGLH